MKFVIKSLLFVNLLLQLTSSLRKCFDHDQNLMLTIILLAFSLIGLIGLTIGNRFILIIFAACMTLMLIASITIHAIGRSEKDSMQPKVPYYVNVPSSDHPGDLEKQQRGGGGDPNKLKSLVSKLLNRNQKTEGKGKNKSRNNRTKTIGNQNNQDQAAYMRRSMTKKVTTGNSSLLMLVPPSNVLIEDYTTDESQVLPQLLAAGLPYSPTAGSSLRNAAANELKAPGGDATPEVKGPGPAVDQEEDDFNQVRSEQWVAYERYLYEKYLNIVSQSIDLVMHTILASWMALLLDDDADQCFGNKNSSSSKSQLVHGHKEAPVYNYNGVRYSIRPDGGDESPTRVVVRGQN